MFLFFVEEFVKAYLFAYNRMHSWGLYKEKRQDCNFTVDEDQVFRKIRRVTWRLDTA